MVRFLYICGLIIKRKLLLYFSLSLLYVNGLDTHFFFVVFSTSKYGSRKKLPKTTSANDPKRLIYVLRLVIFIYIYIFYIIISSTPVLYVVFVLKIEKYI